jgi:hypothetical protein
MKAASVTLALFATAFASALSAQVEEGDARKTLAGLRGVYVSVVPVVEEAPKNAIVAEQIQAEVELQVRHAGITVLKKDDLRRTPGMPYLFVLPSVQRPDSAGKPYLYRVEVEVFQLVVLSRNPEMFALARTWNSRGSLGAAVEANLVTSIKDAVQIMTAQFITAYLYANPKH